MDNRTSDAAVGVHTLNCVIFGDMMESVDVSDSKSDGREVVWVRVPLSPPAPQMFEQVPSLRV